MIVTFSESTFINQINKNTHLKRTENKKKVRKESFVY